MDITPVLNRELMTASRRVGLWGDRVFIAGAMPAIVLVTFAARYYWDGGHDSPALMTRVASQSFPWIALLHGISIVGIASAGAAPSIAGEKGRRTLDFLLATRLDDAEIVMGKLAARMAGVVAHLAAGLPLVLLLHLLGGVDLRLIALAYAGLFTTAFFLIALAIWVSTRAAGLQQAIGAFPGERGASAPLDSLPGRAGGVSPSGFPDPDRGLTPPARLSGQTLTVA